MRKFILGALFALFISQAHAASGIIAGAIRFDAWYANSGNALESQNSMGPLPYQFRSPINCPAASTQKVVCSGAQSVMDAEIASAVSGGLKYWGFNQFSPTSALSAGFNLYQSSTHNADINWCWLSDLGFLGSTGNFSTQNAAYVAQFQQANYQKVTVSSANRPVFYIQWNTANFATNWSSNYTNVAASITDLRAKAIAAGLGTPYIIVMSGVPSTAATIMTNIGADAIGGYNSTFTTVLNGTFASLDTQTQTTWATMAATGAPIVPIAMNGWDTIPRNAKPEASVGTQYLPYIGIMERYAISTNAELVSHLQAAVTYITGHSAAVPSTLLLIYSWNECSEGGGILPSLGDPTGSKLAAIKSTIN